MIRYVYPRIPDPNFFHPRILDPGSKIFGIPDPRSASKNLSIINPKNCFQALGNMIRDVYPRIPDPNFFHPRPGFRVKKVPDPASASKNLSIFNKKKLFLSSRKYDTGCLSSDP
jgi:K+-transporting ATPase c subunit